MKHSISITIMLIFSTLWLVASNDTVLSSSQNTREMTFAEMLNFDSLQAFVNSPLFNDLVDINVEKVDSAYSLNRTYVDSVLIADSLNPNFWRVYGGQAVNVFRTAGGGTNMTLLLFLPLFLGVLLIVVLIYFIKIYFVHEELVLPDKLENENIHDDDGQGTPDN